jgi:colicin V production protein
VTVVGTFIVALIVLHLLTMWIGDMVVDSRVGPLDRTLGFVFGAARGVLICMVGVLFAIWLLSGTATVKTVDSTCTQSATQGPASASAALQQACASYAAAQTPQNEKTLLATCVAFIRENPKPASELEKACDGYVALLGPRGEPDLPVMLATAKSVQPLEEGAYWLIGLLPNDVESELLNILQKHGQGDQEADTKKQVDGDGGDASAPADPTGGAAPSAPAA